MTLRIVAGDKAIGRRRAKGAAAHRLARADILLDDLAQHRGGTRVQAGRQWL